MRVARQRVDAGASGSWPPRMSSAAPTAPWRRSSASSMIAWITGWKPAWPKVTAPSMISSDSSEASDLDHQHAFNGAGDDEVELALFALAGGRVQHVLAVDIADAGGADRAEERNAGEGQRGGGSRPAPTMSGSFSRSWLSTVATTWTSLRKPSGNSGRIGRSIRRRDQGLVLGRAAFTLEEAAGDRARGVGLLLVVHGQREEILPRLGVLGADGGGRAPRCRHRRRRRRHRPDGRSCRSPGSGLAGPIQLFTEKFIEHAHTPARLAGAARQWDGRFGRLWGGASGGMGLAGVYTRNHGPCGRKRRGYKNPVAARTSGCFNAPISRFLHRATMARCGLLADSRRDG